MFAVSGIGPEKKVEKIKTLIEVLHWIYNGYQTYQKAFVFVLAVRKWVIIFFTRYFMKIVYGRSLSSNVDRINYLYL